MQRKPPVFAVKPKVVQPVAGQAVAVQTIAIAGLSAGLVLGAVEGLAQSSVQVRVQRWLQVNQKQGQVSHLQGGQWRAARVGDRLQAIGDGLSTGPNSTARLVVDTGIGTVDVAEKTKLWIQALDFAPDNGRITRIQVGQGQARLRVRPFTHRGSQLEIRTPASLSGVRGTDFGVTVQPNGKTGLAVLNGKVQSAAQGQAKAVPGGYQNFTLPGQPPTPPVPLTNDTALKKTVERRLQGGDRQVRLVGQVDPVNLVMINGVPQVTDQQGRFTTTWQSIPSSFALPVVVITPLGIEQRHIVPLTR